MKGKHYVHLPKEQGGPRKLQAEQPGGRPWSMSSWKVWAPRAREVLTDYSDTVRGKGQEHGM